MTQFTKYLVVMLIWVDMDGGNLMLMAVPRTEATATVNELLQGINDGLLKVLSWGNIKVGVV